MRERANSLRSSSLTGNARRTRCSLRCWLGQEAADRISARLRLHSLTHYERIQPFDAGLELYRRRPDKGYSLTDTMSMVICREHDIEQVLTHDRHFAQEGFEILL